jgi:hypothetical protein
MMHWDCRVFFEDGIFTIRRVYDDDRGAIAACFEKDSAHEGESLEELQAELHLLQEALKKQVLSASDLPKNGDRPQAKKGKSLQAVRQQLGLQSEVAKGS